jgi:predicted nuclease of predicted toxin-antitoxin system
MRFLADESCDFAVVRALRAAGHDVAAVVEISPRADDETVGRLAVQNDRILITEDKDFGQLVFAERQPTGGVLLIRFPARARRQLSATIVDLVRRRGEKLLGDFVVVQPGRSRARKRFG